MIILDTNIISALMRSNPDTEIVSWLNSQPADSIWTTAVCVFEIRFGLNILPPGKRRKALLDQFEQMLQEDFKNRVLNFDLSAAAEAARIAAHLRTIGKPTEIRDVQIAGIAAHRKGVLATRNIRHFADTGIELVNP